MLLKKDFNKKYQPAEPLSRPGKRIYRSIEPIYRLIEPFFQSSEPIFQSIKLIYNSVVSFLRSGILAVRSSAPVFKDIISFFNRKEKSKFIRCKGTFIRHEDVPADPGRAFPVCMHRLLKRVLNAAACSLSLLFFAANVQAEQDAPLLLKVATTKLPESFACQAIEQLKEEIERESDGTIEVQIYPGEQLGSRSDILEGMAIGTIEMAYLSAEPSDAIENNVLRIGDAVTSEQYLWTRQEVRSLENLDGIRIWYQDIGTWIDVFQDVGITAGTLSLTQAYDGLQAGLLDGVLLDEETVYRYKLYECCKFCCELEAFHCEETFFISEDVLSQLGEQKQEIVEKAAGHCTDRIREQMQEGEEKLRTELENSGVRFSGKSSDIARALDKKVTEEQ